MPAAQEHLAYTYTLWGDANRMRGAIKRSWQAKAMRSINAARAQLRAARAALAAAEAAMIPLPLLAAPDLTLTA